MKRKSTKTSNLRIKLDDELVFIISLIEEQKIRYKKHTKIRIDQWTAKLCQPTKNYQWKKMRNSYAILLLYNLEKK